MENKDTEKTIFDIIEEIKESICDTYCKYPQAYENEDEMIAERCEKCPLNRLM